MGVGAAFLSNRLNGERRVHIWRRRAASLVLAAGLAAGTGSVASAQSFDWQTQLGAVTRFLETPGRFNAANCATSIESFADRLERLPSGAFAPQTPADSAAAEAAAPRALEGFFRVRLLLKQRLDSFAAPSTACLNAVRRGMRVARFAEDYLADWLRARGREQTQASRLFGGGPAQVEINPSVGSVDIRTGDLLLMRGPSFVSALIARSGDEEGDFSHLAIVGEDAAGKKHVVEALIEKGVVTIPLDEYLENKAEGRVVLLRHRDAATALRAGRAIYDKAHEATERGQPIRYNFRLDRRDFSRLFCAQVISYAYYLASNGRLDLPRYPSTLARLKQTPIYSALGIRALQTFSPSDIQFDPRFTIVAEYRNSRYLRAMRHGNIVLSKMLAWLRSGYTFREDSFGDFVAGLVLRFIDRGEISEETGAPSKAGVAIMVAVGRVASALVDAAAAIDQAAESASGHALTYRELGERLEASRSNACVSAETSTVQRLLVAPAGACRTAAR